MQKTILYYLTENYSYQKYDDIRSFVSEICDENISKRTFMGATIFNSSKNFNIVFSQSIRNLHKKGLVELKYMCEVSDSYYYQFKKCKDKEPYENQPCEDCFYVKKHPFAELYIVDENCHFCYCSGSRGINSVKKRIHSVNITDNGKETIIKSLRTPKMIKEITEEVETRRKVLKDVYGNEITEEEIEIDMQTLFDETLKEKIKQKMESRE